MAGISVGLGALTLQLIAKTGGFTAPLTAAERKLQKSMTSMEKRAREFGRVLGQALQVGAGLAVAGLTLFIKNTIEAEKVQSQLASRIKDTAGIAGRSLQQLNAQAEKLQTITVFDDEAIGSAQAMLLTFKNIQGVNFDKAVEGVLDLSTAMGTDLNSAALQLGKALNDPIAGLGALSRAGIQFSSDQKALIKSLVETGDTAGAQKIILAELEGQMGTAAEAARDTLGGALQALKNSFDNLFEGDTATPGMEGFREAVEQMNTAINDPGVKEGLNTIITGLANLATAAVKAASWVAASTKRIAEDIAASIHGIAGDDLKRQAQAIEAKRQRASMTMLPGMRWQQEAEIKKMEAVFKKNQAQAIADAVRMRPAYTPPAAGFKSGKGQFSDVTNDYTSRPAAGVGVGGRGGGGGGGRAAAADNRENAAALKALADEQERYNELEEVYADIAEMTQGYRSDLIKDNHALTVQKEENIKQIDAEIEGMQFELSLIGLSNIEREKEIALRHAGADATEAQRAAISGLIDEIAAAQEQQAFIDDLKGSLSDMFVDMVSGAKSAKEAFKDFADNLFATALRFVADRAMKAFMDALSGNTGAQSTAGGGGGWQNLLASFLGGMGGGKALGGGVSPGQMYPVNERGPEVLSVAGRDYLMMGQQAGRVLPSAGGVVVNNNFALAAPTSPRTQAQISSRVGFETDRAIKRNR